MNESTHVVCLHNGYYSALKRNEVLITCYNMYQNIV